VQSLVLFLAIIFAFVPSELRDAESQPAGSDSSLARRDSLEKAITILLPGLEHKAERADSSARSEQLYQVLTVARGYLELGLYAQADYWFERLEALDGEGLFEEAIFHGRLSSLAGKGRLDSLAVLLGAREGALVEEDAQLLVALLVQIGRLGRWGEVESLINQSLPLFGAKPPASVVYLQGRALRRQGRLADAVFHFETQINALKVPDSVHPTFRGARTRFIQGAADCSFLLNDRMRARSHYAQLMEEDDLFYSSWGRFQTAQLDMLGSEYERAAVGFERVAGLGMGLSIEDWSEKLAKHCEAMREHRARAQRAQIGFTGNLP
jgi:tetratricopeptide (TPR) repeat protein